MAAHYFFCGIGGSGMLPLARILLARGASVSGSDRARDQGKTPDKFSELETQGIKLYPQDGSGITADITALVISTAVEDSIPDVSAAKHKKITIIRRAQLLATLFNNAHTRIAVGGTSGKSTVTAMTGYILTEAGQGPTVMNGAGFKNYGGQSALIGPGDMMVIEADESDGSIELYEPTIAVLNNISLDHKPMDELMELFTGFIERADKAVMNVDDKPVSRLAGGLAGKILTYSVKNELADMWAGAITPDASGTSAMVHFHGMSYPLRVNVPGIHNLSNAMAALCAATLAGVDMKTAVDLISGYSGIKRRMDVVGVKKGITVMDDFAHNPDKISATLKTLKAFPGRVRIFFQPHGYSFLKLMHADVAQAFTDYLSAEDLLLMTEPYYAGGTVDRSVTTAHLMALVREKHPDAYVCEDRADVKRRLLENAVSGDRIVIMGARDDTLPEFAADILSSL